MPVEKFVGVGTERRHDVFEYVLEILETERPTTLALDENPIAFSTLIQMRRSPELFNEKFVRDQKVFLLKREIDVGNSAAIVYALRHAGTPVHFADGSFQEPLSDTGEENGIYPYFIDVDFAAATDLMTTPVELIKERIPMYPGQEFDYQLIHAYQTDTNNEQMDRAIWQRNQYTAKVLNKIIRASNGGILAFIGDRKRFDSELYRRIAGLDEKELAQYMSLNELIDAEHIVVYDAVEKSMKQS